MKKKTYPIMNIGSASLLVIFIILCMVTFGALSITSAHRDYLQSRTIADRTTAYYEACNKAELHLQKIDGLLKTSNPEDLETSLRDLGVTITDSDSLQYTVPIDDSQHLEVHLKLHETFYTITCWKSIRTGHWNGDTTLDLM